jgi:uncharacterized membrane protein YfbV (UPF0208 family)
MSGELVGRNKRKQGDSLDAKEEKRLKAFAGSLLYSLEKIQNILNMSYRSLQFFSINNPVFLAEVWGKIRHTDPMRLTLLIAIGVCLISIIVICTAFGGPAGFAIGLAIAVALVAIGFPVGYFVAKGAFLAKDATTEYLVNFSYYQDGIKSLKFFSPYRSNENYQTAPTNIKLRQTFQEVRTNLCKQMTKRVMPLLLKCLLGLVILVVLVTMPISISSIRHKFRRNEPILSNDGVLVLAAM